jgi:hypothetical protein
MEACSAANLKAGRPTTSKARQACAHLDEAAQW